MVQSSPKAEVTGSNPVGRATVDGSVPDTWVTVYSGDMGNTLVVSCHFVTGSEAARSLRRYMEARFASGFASAQALPGAGNALAPKGLSRGSSLQVSWSK
jgi:hypothetical protein